MLGPDKRTPTSQLLQLHVAIVYIFLMKNRRTFYFVVEIITIKIERERDNRIIIISDFFSRKKEKKIIATKFNPNKQKKI